MLLSILIQVTVSAPGNPCWTAYSAGTLMVREDSHTQHEKFWGEVSGMSEADKAAHGDFYMFKPEVRRFAHCR